MRRATACAPWSGTGLTCSASTRCAPRGRSLRKGKGTPLCEALERDWQAAYLGEGVAVNPLGEREVGFIPLPRTRAEDDPEPVILLRAEANPFNDGTPLAVLRATMAGDSRRVPSWAYMTIAPKSLDDFVRRLAAGEKVEAELPDQAEEWLEQRWIFEVPRLFRDGERVLVLSPTDVDAKQYEVFAAAPRKRLCLFQVKPDIDPGLWEGATAEGGPLRAPPAEDRESLAHRSPDSPREDWRTRSERARHRPWSVAPRPSAKPLTVVKAERGHDLVIDGKVVHHFDDTFFANIEGRWGDVTLIGFGNGGNACMVEYVIVEVDDDGKVAVTEFGNCGELEADLRASTLYLNFPSDGSEAWTYSEGELRKSTAE